MQGACSSRLQPRLGPSRSEHLGTAVGLSEHPSNFHPNEEGASGLVPSVASAWPHSQGTEKSLGPEKNENKMKMFNPKVVFRIYMEFYFLQVPL